jgi:hypothetical protein
MTRGRRPDPEAEPSRQLQTQRAFRKRRAERFLELQERIVALQEENDSLRAAKGEVVETKTNSNGTHGHSSTSSISSGSTADRDSGRLACEKCKESRANQQEMVREIETEREEEV